MQRAPSPEDKAETQVDKRARACCSKKVVVDVRRLREMESTVSCIERRTMYHGISPVEVVRQLIEVWETLEPHCGPHQAARAHEGHPDQLQDGPEPALQEHESSGAA